MIFNKEITYPNKLQNEITNFYESLSKKGASKSPSQINDFLGKVQLPTLKVNECDNELSEKQLYMSLMNMQSKKPPGNDGRLIKDFL